MRQEKKNIGRYSLGEKIANAVILALVLPPVIFSAVVVLAAHMGW